ncbi:MAG: restriction endonuclease subunit S [Anaerolineales bacterium]|nr:restriction endonuclease subunit S [Anaerolineales bacterium]
MEVRKGYKQTEIGIIPEDWSSITLEEVTTRLVRGPFGGALKKAFFVERGYKVYEQRNAIYETTEIGNYYIDLIKYKELERFRVQSGDFIVSCAGTIGRIFQIPKEAPEGVINQALLKISINSETIKESFFLTNFKSQSFQERIKENSHGGAMQNLVGMDVFRKTLFFLPPTLAEQEAIAEALSDADALIESLETLLTKKRQVKQGAMQELLTGKRRLAGFSDEWKEKRLGNSATLKARIGWQGLTTAEYLDSGDYYLITGTEFKDGFIDWKNCHYVTEARYKQDKNIQVREHDVLVTKDGTIGKIALITNLTKPATLNSGVFVIRPIDNMFYPEFFYYLLCSSVFIEFLDQLSAGSTINHLYQKDFVNFVYKTPPTIAEQTAIAEILSDMDAEITTLEEKLVKARQVKQGMMSELLTGRIRLV